MRALVTGVAGFVGSTLAEALVNSGWIVRGVDSFEPYYDVRVKRENVRELALSGRFELVQADLLKVDLVKTLKDVDVVFHQAAQPGVRASWSREFQLYNRLNVDVTQRLLEAVRGANVSRLVYASSSSVYGQVTDYPTNESAATCPFSPYGVTKLAGELLCRAYAENFGLPVTMLRYFTVYGPRQRPDMAIHRLIESARHGLPFTLFGDGEQVRDFTFVNDVVKANILAATTNLSGASVFNIAGGSSIRMSALVEMVSAAVGKPIDIDWQPSQPGDVRGTGGDIRRAREQLAWAPQFGLPEGIERQVEWHLSAIQKS